MFNNLPSLFRLSLCLLLSASLHGGAVFYDWMLSPAESRLGHTPVVVSFLPATDVVSTVLSERPKPLPNLALATNKPRVPEVKQPVAPPKKAVPSPPKRSAAKVLPKKSLDPVVTEESKAITSSAEMVCMAPQEVPSDDSSELFADSQLDIAPGEKGATLDEAPQDTERMVPEAVEDGLLDSTLVSAPQSQIEAVPNYRSNPLPEYPYLARQKHWEGVVWLLVDVSSKGWVDDLRIEKSCGHRILDRTAKRTVSRWQFSPATRAGLAVSSQVRIPVRFRLEDD